MIAGNTDLGWVLTPTQRPLFVLVFDGRACLRTVRTRSSDLRWRSSALRWRPSGLRSSSSDVRSRTCDLSCRSSYYPGGAGPGTHLKDSCFFDFLWQGK
jgi:hypothetical protein